MVVIQKNKAVSKIISSGQERKSGGSVKFNCRRKYEQKCEYQRKKLS